MNSAKLNYCIAAICAGLGVLAACLWRRHHEGAVASISGREQMNNDVIAALETLCDAAPARHFDDEIAAVRAHADALRQGGERRDDELGLAIAYENGHAAGMAEATAKAVAWLRDQSNSGDDIDHAAYGWAADAIGAGAHLAGEGRFNTAWTDNGPRPGAGEYKLGAHLAGDGE